MQNDLKILSEKLSIAKDILILVVNNPSLDVMAASLGLYLSLKDAGKRVKIVCETEVTVRDSHLVGIDEVKTNLGGQNLVLTVNVEGDVVDKVTSSVENGKLSLTIIPKSGVKPLEKEDILFTSSGAYSDLVFVMGAGSLNDLGNIAISEAEFFKKTTLANLSSVAGSSFGTLNLVDDKGALSELVTALIQEFKLNITEDIASNLMLGIEVKTNNLQSPDMTADTFEALAVLYRAGARHKVLEVLPTATIIDNTPIIEERIHEDQADIKALENELHAMTTPKEDIAAKVEAATVGAHSQPSPDWLKPKIYKSGSDK